MDTIKNINSEGIDIMENLNSALIFLFGNENLKILHALIVLTILDYITGVCVAIKMGRISSAIGAKGIAGKVIIYALISLSNIFDTYFLTANGILEAATILFYCGYRNGWQKKRIGEGHTTTPVLRCEQPQILNVSYW